jgi:hypothetical protein
MINRIIILRYVVKELFDSWKLKSEFARIQWVYALTAVVLLIVGGLIGLIDSRSGVQIADFSLYAGAIFIINFVLNSVLTTLFGTVKPRQNRR